MFQEILRMQPNHIVKDLKNGIEASVYKQTISIVIIMECCDEWKLGILSKQDKIFQL